MNLKKFWIEWFGIVGGRELGTNREPHRVFTDNPEDLINHIEKCSNEGRPVWLTVQPMRAYQQSMAIEKLFFDFDDDSKYCSKCEIYIKKDNLVKETIDNVRRGGLCPNCKTECVEKPRTELIAKEVLKFLEGVEKICKAQKEKFIPTPFIVKTYKGFHVYFFLTEIFQFNPNLNDEAEELYELMQKMIIEQISNYEFLDTMLIGGLTKFARVPLTYHEKSGELCEILNPELETTKVRSLEYYRTYGIPTSFVKRAIEIMKHRRAKKYKEEKATIKNLEKEVKNGNGDGVEFGHGIRPCFKERMGKGEANHAMRLAWLSEIYYSGYNTPEKMLELCRQTWSDFKEKTSMAQVEDYFKHERYLYHPYKCTTIREKGWCLGTEECRKRRGIEKTDKHD